MTNDDKLFWEKFGFVLVEDKIIPDENLRDVHVCIWNLNGERFVDLPEPNLDNLFKYCWNKAVDTLFCTGKYKSMYHAERKMHLIWVRYSNTIVDPALALKKAIEEIGEALTCNGFADKVAAQMVKAEKDNILKEFDCLKLAPNDNEHFRILVERTLHYLKTGERRMEATI